VNGAWQGFFVGRRVRISKAIIARSDDDDDDDDDDDRDGTVAGFVGESGT
jgi:hypothetical protein